MIMHTEGRREDPAVLMLHPMGITGWMIYEMIGSRFKKDYYFLLPDMGGHGEEKEDFVSAPYEAEKIREDLAERGIHEIALVYGVSMGAAAALQLLKYEDLKIRCLYLDGAPIAKLDPFMSRIFGPVLVWQKKLYIEKDEKKLKEYIDRWGREINDHMAENFSRFSKETIYRIADACTEGNAACIPQNLQGHTYMEWGADELYAKTSPALVKKLYPRVHLCVRKGYNHCEYMMKESGSYAAFMEKALGRALKETAAKRAFDPLVRTLSREETEEIGHAFGFYGYGTERGMVQAFRSREAADLYIRGYAETAFRKGNLYTCSDRREGYIAYSVCSFEKERKRSKVSAYMPLFKGVFASMSPKEIAGTIKTL
jgi:pimeloyl-ACP methyl ester carboxylesterase